MGFFIHWHVVDQCSLFGVGCHACTRAHIWWLMNDDLMTHSHTLPRQTQRRRIDHDEDAGNVVVVSRGRFSQTILSNYKGIKIYAEPLDTIALKKPGQRQDIIHFIYYVYLSANHATPHTIWLFFLFSLPVCNRRSTAGANTHAFALHTPHDHFVNFSVKVIKTARGYSLYSLGVCVCVCAAVSWCLYNVHCAWKLCDAPAIQAAENINGKHFMCYFVPPFVRSFTTFFLRIFFSSARSVDACVHFIQFV